MRPPTRALAIALLLAGTASAQVDPDPNGVGIYFDEAATRTTAISGVPVPPDYASVQAWLILTRCSLAGSVGYWEGMVRAEGRYGFIWGTPIAGVNIADNMPGEAHWSFRVDFDAGLGLPVTATTVLSALEIGIFPEGDGPTFLYVDGVRVQVGEQQVLPHPSSGSAALPVAVINGDAPVRRDAGTWGAVKTLYSD